MGSAITAPELFGIDPDETWDFVPTLSEGLPEQDRPVFTLRAPDAGLADLMALNDDKARAEAHRACPAEVVTINALRKIPEAERTEQQASDYAEAVAKFGEAWIAAAEKIDRVSLQRKVFAKCVTGWRNFRRKDGKELPFPADSSRIVDFMPGALRGEVFAAIQAGATVTDEERASLT